MSANILILAQWNWFQTSDLHAYKIRDLCNFKPLNVWWFVTVAMENSHFFYRQRTFNSVSSVYDIWTLKLYIKLLVILIYSHTESSHHYHPPNEVAINFINHLWNVLCQYSDPRFDEKVLIYPNTHAKNAEFSCNFAYSMSFIYQNVKLS